MIDKWLDFAHELMQTMLVIWLVWNVYKMKE